jgi:hypothetical protein
LRALSRAIRRDLGTFASIKVNNFFLFVALLIYGALNSGLPPKSAYPFLLLLGLLLLFPLSSDPLSRIPPDRLALWPFNPAQRLAFYRGPRSVGSGPDPDRFHFGVRRGSCWDSLPGGGRGSLPVLGRLVRAVLGPRAIEDG